MKYDRIIYLSSAIFFLYIDRNKKEIVKMRVRIVDGTRGKLQGDNVFTQRFNCLSTGINSSE